MQILFRMISVFQCSDEKCGPLLECDKTLHILCHIANTTVSEARSNVLPNFVTTHWEWIEKVGSHILQRKGLDVKDYCSKLITGAIPFDELGILILLVRWKYMSVYFLVTNTGIQIETRECSVGTECFSTMDVWNFGM